MWLPLYVFDQAALHREKSYFRQQICAGYLTGIYFLAEFGTYCSVCQLKKRLVFDRLVEERKRGRKNALSHSVLDFKNKIKVKPKKKPKRRHLFILFCTALVIVMMVMVASL